MFDNPLPEDLLAQCERLLLRRQPLEAVALAHRVIGGAPGNSRALHLAGLAAALEEDSATAVEYLTRAIELEPDRAEWLADLGTVLFAAGRPGEAEDWCLRAVALNPGCGPAHDLLAKVASHQGRDHIVRQHLQALAALRPGDTKIKARLAVSEYAVGNFAEAIRLLRALICEGMATQQLHSEYVSALLYDPSQTRESLRLEYEAWAGHWCQTSEGRPIARARGKRRLRIGYLSGEFAATPSRHFLLPIFRHHDRERFEITCYHARSGDDVYTERHRKLVDRWRNCWEMSDEDLAQRIVADEIDILVDLSGHFRCHRLSVFGLKAAPVQVAYPTYPCTTGVSSIRYILTDRWVCPQGAEHQYTEQPHFLSCGYLTYEPPAEAPEVTDACCDPQGGVVFGLFQWPAKWNAGTWDAVAGVLKACPNSRLLVHYSSVELDQTNSPARERVECELAARGISPALVRYCGWLPLARHLKLLSQVDIALDTFPFNGTTTTCECLWMGVPVVTLRGDTHVSRVGYQLLDRIGLGELAAATPREYLETAATLAQDRKWLRELRRGLRDRMRQSTLLNPLPLVREIEAAYLQMWKQLTEENQ